MKEVSREYREEKCFIRKKYLEKIRKIRVSEFLSPWLLCSTITIFWDGGELLKTFIQLLYN